MNRLSDAVFGWVRIKIDPKDELNALNNAVKHGILLSSLGGDEYATELFGYKKHLLLLGVECRVVGFCGILGGIYKNRFRAGVFAGLILSLCLYFLLFGMVWDVRVETDGGIDGDAVEEMLLRCGVYDGARWRDLDIDKAELSVLELSSDISWVAIDRRGMVAYARISTKDNHLVEDESGYSNMIAAVDCVIEDITVISGYPAVKVGDTVKAGDLLISGIIPTEMGGGFCHAKGEVIGRYSDELLVVCESKQTETVYGERRLSSVSLNLFSFSLKIFERSRNLGNSYAIIEEKMDFDPRGGRELPFSITKRYAVECKEVDYLLDSAGLVSLAGEKMRDLLLQYLSDKDVISLSSSGEYIDGGYRLATALTFRGSVCKDLKFDYLPE